MDSIWKRRRDWDEVIAEIAAGGILDLEGRLGLQPGEIRGTSPLVQISDVPLPMDAVCGYLGGYLCSLWHRETAGPRTIAAYWIWSCWKGSVGGIAAAVRASAASAFLQSMIRLRRSLRRPVAPDAPSSVTAHDP